MNTIKTKIGFDTKPYTIQAIDIRDLFSFSAKFYGNILLLLAIALSIGSIISLKSMKSEKMYQLQSHQQTTMQLQQQHDQLVKEYDFLASSARLQSLASKINMRKPTLEETIYLPSFQTK